MTCVIDGCDKPVYPRSYRKKWCVTHYRRWAAHGDPLTILNGRGTPLIERFRKRIILAPEGCWQWIGPISPGGYGAFSIAHKSGRRIAHRWSYEYHKGPIPEGLTIDHLCRNRACVNPDHLEAVTIQENLARAAGRRSTCKRGHPIPAYEPGVRRACRQCQRLTDDARRVY